jgi:hypothetical protein
VACGILQKENSPNQSFAKLAMSVANPCAISCETEYLRFLRNRTSEGLFSRQGTALSGSQFTASFLSLRVIRAAPAPKGQNANKMNRSAS